MHIVLRVVRVVVVEHMRDVLDVFKRVKVSTALLWSRGVSCDSNSNPLPDASKICLVRSMRHAHSDLLDCGAEERWLDTHGTHIYILCHGPRYRSPTGSLERARLLQSNATQH